MAILVTGGLGYIGSVAAKQLADRGEQVVILDSLEFGHREAACGSEVVVGNTGDREFVRQVFSTHKIEAIMHFAAYLAVGESVVEPSKYYWNNVSNALAMLEVAVECGVKMMIFSSTAAVFGEPRVVPIREDHPKSPVNPYGRSKLMVEEILRDYERAYGLRSVSLRYFNASGADPSGLIGEDHDPEPHLVPIVLEAAMGKRENVKVFGTDYPTPDGTCVRDYVHVSDLSQAHLLALDALREGKETTAYNLGNGSGYSVLEVIKVAEEVTGKQISVQNADRRAGDPAVLVASSEKIIRELGWKPNYPDLKTIVQTAWNWHSNHPKGYGSK